MENRKKSIMDGLITHRFAVTVISILFGCSAACWIISEIIPPDVPYNQMYRMRWGEQAVRAIRFLGLHDPFHSFWYRAVLALFFIVLLLCIVTRWGRLISRSFRLRPPPSSRDFKARTPHIEIFWSDLTRGERASRDVLDRYEKMYGKVIKIDSGTMKVMFGKLGALLRRRGYRVVAGEKSEGILFAAVAGRWRFVGNFLFHLGILIITVGGVIGSFFGGTEVLYGRAGDILPMHGSSYSILVEDFDIIKTAMMEDKDYISTVSVLDSEGNRLQTNKIEVNHPLGFQGYNVLQSSYHVDDEEFRWADIGFTPPGGFRTYVVRITPGEGVPLLETSLVIKAKRFFPDFRMSPEGPYSASLEMANPALEIEVTSESDSEKGWLFLFYPQFNTPFRAPLQLRLEDIAPVYYTGLQISTNPGARILLTGIIVATVGLLFLYTFNYRSIRGVLGEEALVIAGTRYRWKTSFENELHNLREVLIENLSDVLENDAGGMK